jgi:hypothetical protein
MNAIDHRTPPPASGLGAQEGFMEAGLAIAAAAFTIAVWLSTGAGTAVQLATHELELAASGIPLITLPTVYIGSTGQR